MKRGGQPIVPHGQRGEEEKTQQRAGVLQGDCQAVASDGGGRRVASQLREKNKEMKENSSLMEELLKPEVEVDDETMFLWWLELWAVVSWYLCSWQGICVASMRSSSLIGAGF